MYEKTISVSAEEKRGRTKRDGVLLVCVATAVLVTLLLILPLAYSMQMMYRYHSFTQDLAASFVYGERSGTLTLVRDETETSVEKTRAERVYSLILSAGMGHPRRALLETEGLTLDFGEGSALQIWPVAITEKGRDNDTGIRLRYTRPDGTAFSYDTDDLQYEDFLRILG